MKRLAITSVLALASLAAAAQGYTNPVISGMNPDPSVCRVGDDYYLVSSSFHYFPGVPLYHSKDLVNWERIGHVLTRESQLPLKDAHSWNGIYAPVIRYHDGTFYMITTNTSGKGNFIVTTKDIRGEWSEPIWIDMPGIDPELFWDDDGTCYYTGSGNDGIIQCKINPDTGEQLSGPKIISYGTGGRYPESPHIIKKDGMYWLLMAEGGTEFGHMVTIFRSRYVDGPYEPAPHNPILTHFKQSTQGSQIQGLGHADLIQAHDGSWWMICLGFRIQGGQHHLLGRETFLAPVSWEKGFWPVVNGTGDITLNMDVPTLPLKPFEARPERDEFEGRRLGTEWSWIRNPDMSRYALGNGALRLYGTAAGLDEFSASPTFVGFRQQDIDFTAETCVDFLDARNGDKAGMTVMMDAGSHYDVYLTKKGGSWKVVANYSLGAINHLEEFAVRGSKVWLRITGEGEYYRLWYSYNGLDFKQIGIGNTRYLSSETVSGFTGIMIGLWAESPTGKGVAEFDYFEYK